MHNNVGRWNKNEVSMDKMPRCSVIYKSIKHKNSNRL
ncbi:unknown [Roseburia sp. CAG:380]|nr:unknown [Roseburia sp. CAG:380]